MSIVKCRRGKTEKQLEINRECTVSEVLRSAGMAVDEPCGGYGKCGKCLVVLTDADGEREVRACSTFINDDCEIRVPERGTHSALTDTENLGSLNCDRHGLGAALDLGTTTLALKLYELETGRLLATVSSGNPQAVHGADVISRLSFAVESAENNAELSQLVLDALESMLCRAAEIAGTDRKNIKLATVAGNTTMQHFFAGLDPKGLATAPFAPASMFDDGKMFISCRVPDTEVIMTPCIGPFVGGDILAGIASSGMAEREELSLFLDIGTNGEMALGNKSGIVCCSVASGPAFEGAEISCGMPGISGAVSRAAYENGALKLETIDDAPPAGICGSGLIELLAVLLELGIVDEGGRLLPPDELDEEFPFITEDEDGNGLCVLDAERGISLTAGDVRALQLAKAAVAAGINVMLAETGREVTQVDRLILAGGFGSRLSIKAAARIGLIPQELTEKTEVLGNCSLAGAAELLLDSGEYERFLSLRQLCRVTELSGSRLFSDEFINQMMFE